MEPSILSIVAWLGLAWVNVIVGKEKGISISLLIIPSLVAAPLIYLYVLAVPVMKSGTRETTQATTEQVNGLTLPAWFDTLGSF